MSTQIAILELAFHGACFAIHTFRNSLHFARDAERLMLTLEMERFRLLVWGENSGLTCARLPARLVSLANVLHRELEGIRQLFVNADALRARYGLIEAQARSEASPALRRMVERMQRAIRAAGVSSGGDGGGDFTKDVGGGVGGGQDANMCDAMQLDEEAGTQETKTTTLKLPPSPAKHIQWAIRDADRFDALVMELSTRITKLNQLLTETQQRQAAEDADRVAIVFVTSVDDQPTLKLVLDAVQAAPSTSQTRSCIENMAIAALMPLPHATTLEPHSLSDFILPEGFASMQRFVAVKKTNSDHVYLLERKDFDPSISTQDKKLLTTRIQHLVRLLSKPKTPEFKTPVAQGCIHDPSRFCWWLVLRLAAPSPNPSTPLPAEPTSLSHLIDPKTKFRPPLEQRYSLASALCATLSELFSSSWLHKGIRSTNILFTCPIPSYPPTPTQTPTPSSTPNASQTSAVLQTFQLCGFDYTRQESERTTIDKAKQSNDIATAIFRHPHYQGDAAEGYRIHYDIYSLGLVLVEIALWKPLSSFLQAKSHHLAVFHEPHAAALKRRVAQTVDSEFAFRVGSKYYEATKFCLEFADATPTAVEDEFPPHPSLEFYNQVVVPLSRLAREFPCE